MIFFPNSCIPRNSIKLLSPNRSVKHNKLPQNKNRQDDVDTACGFGSVFALIYMHTCAFSLLTFVQIKCFLTADPRVPAGKSPRLTPSHISDCCLALTNNLTFQLPQFHPHKLHSCMSIVVLFNLLSAFSGIIDLPHHLEIL